MVSRVIFSARRAVIVSKPQALAWGKGKDSVASEAICDRIWLLYFKPQTEHTIKLGLVI